MTSRASQPETGADFFASQASQGSFQLNAKPAPIEIINPPNSNEKKVAILKRLNVRNRAVPSSEENTPARVNEQSLPKK